MAISTAVSSSAVARRLGISTSFVNLKTSTSKLPMRVALIGQGSSASTYDTTKTAYTKASSVGSAYGYGSPVHLAAKQLFPANGDGLGDIVMTVYPLDDDDSGVAASGDITPSGTQTESESYTVVVNNIESNEFVIAADDSVATITAAITTAINATLAMPVIATDGTTTVNLSSKWAGLSANDIYVEIDGSTTAGTTFTITQLSGGLVNPDVQDALDQVGSVWETLVVNCLNIDDTDTLDIYQTFGESRWGSSVRKPLIVFTGTTESDVDTAIVIPSARTDDYVNSQLVEPASNDLPLQIAARGVVRIATVANELPAWDYGAQELDGLTPGDDGDQWDLADQQTAVTGGSSTIDVDDETVYMADTITFYHPDDEDPPAYRYVCDIIKLMNVLYNFDLKFNSDEWNGAPLLPDSQTVAAGVGAKKPRMWKADAAQIIDNLALDAIISDPDTAKASLSAGINEDNPKRLDGAVTVQLSGNTNIISIDLDFGFYFGSTTTTV